LNIRRFSCGSITAQAPFGKTRATHDYFDQKEKKTGSKMLRQESVHYVKEKDIQWQEKQ